MAGRQLILLTGLSSWGQHKFLNSDQLTWDRIFNNEQCNSFYPLQKYKETKSTSLLLLQRKTKLKDNNKILILHIAIYPTRREEEAAAAVSLILITYKQCDYTGTGHRLVFLVWETGKLIQDWLDFTWRGHSFSNPHFPCWGSQLETGEC